MKFTTYLLLSILLLIFSGCAVIDFLDGKHLNHTPDYDRSQYSSGSNNGGHSH